MATRAPKKEANEDGLAASRPGAEPMFAWHLPVFESLLQQRANLPHALLAYGPAGSGKTVFGERLAQALLCENRSPLAQACGVCPSCTWYLQGNHPDFRLLRPESFEAQAQAKGDAKTEGKEGKEGSKEIRIDQVRELADFINLSTHRRGLRIILLYPAQSLNLASSNALLKTLEEPPPSTLFILVADSLDRLLPTILSRCRKLALPAPTPAQALAWLQAQGVPEAEVWLASQGGAPLAAREMAQQGRGEELDLWLSHLAAPGTEGALRTADKLQKTAPLQLLSWMQRWLYDMLSLKLAQQLRYYPRHRSQLEALAARVTPQQITAALKACKERRLIAEHPLAPKLFIEDMLLEYQSCLKKTA
ncbi:DNA polymerase III subunit delta' [Massilia sp. W12]|uniref:DNA polymerase III subunit delta' n=1 Tax=Massilia sp. W12 TaxID=3126507 RepID=UPI0030D350A1